LRIQKGELVEWTLDTDAAEISGSRLYQNQKRMHIISFDNICEESEPMRNSKDTYKHRFFDAGKFTYKCSIYTRMKGTIEVYDSAPSVSKLDIHAIYKPIQETKEIEKRG
jgi:plastocyanin